MTFTATPNDKHEGFLCFPACLQQLKGIPFLSPFTCVLSITPEDSSNSPVAESPCHTEVSDDEEELDPIVQVQF